MATNTNIKVLIIRFSSFGDVIQCLSVPGKLKEIFPDSHIHWLTRQDMVPLITPHPLVNKVIQFDRKLGLGGLLKLAWSLRSENYTHIYDAHNNLRSTLVGWILRFFKISPPQFTQKSIKRIKRFLLFSLRINKFEQPFNGQRDLLEPLLNWGAVDTKAPPTPQYFVNPETLYKAIEMLGEFCGAIALAPSAAYPLKRWPLTHWKSLVQSLPDKKFIILGGPEDTFLKDFELVAPERVLNLVGRCNFEISAAIVSLSSHLVANDTGLMHIGEQLGKSTVALMGPAPFGFPSRSSTLVLERKLACRPCSKHGQGPCVNKNHHECLASISPQEVQQSLESFSL